METLFTLPSKTDIRGKLATIEQDRMCGEHNLPAELEQLGGQEFVPNGLALVLLVAAKRALQKTYGKEKSMWSTEGQVLVFNIMPKYIEAMMGDQVQVPEMVKLMKENMIMFT